MAWICLYQDLLGGKLRELHKKIGCSRNEALGILNGLWLWGISNANRDGMLRGCDSSDVIENIAIGLDKRYKPENVYEALVSEGWLEVTEDGTIYIHDWQEAQRYFYKYKEDKERNKIRQKRYRDRHTEDNGNSNGDSNATITQMIKTEKEKKPEIPAAKASRYTADGFNEFWEAYPRKDDKGQAYTQYKARLRNGYSPEEMIAAAKAYADYCRRTNREKEFTKQAKTFIGAQTPFIEYIPKKEEPKRPAGENPFL